MTCAMNILIANTPTSSDGLLGDDEQGRLQERVADAQGDVGDPGKHTWGGGPRKYLGPGRQTLVY